MKRLALLLLLLPGLALAQGTTNPLTYNQLIYSGNTFSPAGTWTFTGRLGIPAGTTPPPTECDEAGEAGRLYFDTDGASGSQLYGCEGVAGWVLQGPAGGSPAFSAITSATNTTAAMLVGTGGTLGVTGTGKITASHLDTATLISCGSNPAKIRIQNGAAGAAAPIKLCDNQATPAVRYAADADSTGKALTAATADSATSASDLTCTDCVSDGEVVDTITASNYLPLAGGTMTGAVTTKTTDVAAILPAGGVGNQTSIEFQSQGDYQNGSWFLQNATPTTGVSSEDHVLIFGYNLKADGANAFSRPLSGEHAVRVGFESGWCGATCDPNTYLGSFEFNIDIDTDTSGAIVTDVRPFFFKYRMQDGSAGDAYSKTLFRVGVDDANDAYFNVGGQTYMQMKAGKNSSGAALQIILSSPTVFGADVFTPAKVFVDGTSDEVQLRVQGHSTQTSQIFLVESDGAVSRFAVYNDGGALFSYANFQESDTDPYCDVGEFNLFGDDSEDKLKVCENGKKRQIVAQSSGTVTEDLTDPSGGCIEGSAVTVSGATFGEGCILGTSAALPTGVMGNCRITAADTAKASLCGTGDPANMTYTLRIIR